MRDEESKRLLFHPSSLITKKKVARVRFISLKACADESVGEGCFKFGADAELLAACLCRILSNERGPI